MGILVFDNTASYIARCDRQAASIRYWRAKGCSEWKAFELARRYGFRESHRAFFRSSYHPPKQSARVRR